MDEADGAAVEIVEVVPGGIALAQPLQRHRPPRRPTAGLQRLLERLDFVGIGIDEPDKPLGPGGRRRRDRLRRRKHRLQALQRALPRRLDREEGAEAEGDLVVRSVEPGAIGRGIRAHAHQRLRQ
jgi:hypothetical protein